MRSILFCPLFFFLLIYKWCNARNSIIAYFFSTSIWFFFRPTWPKNFSLNVIWKRHYCWCSMQMLTYNRHSLAYHTYCETGHPYIVSAQRTRTHTCCRAFGSETISLIVLTTSWQESNPYLPHARYKHYTNWATARRFNDFEYMNFFHVYVLYRLRNLHVPLFLLKGHKLSKDFCQENTYSV